MNSSLVVDFAFLSGLSAMTCRTNNISVSTMPVTPPHLLQGLMNTESLNPGLTFNGEHAYIACSGGGKISITKTTVGLQLYMHAAGCQAGKTHVLLRTPHGVAKPGSMECVFCHCDGARYTGPGLPPSKDELHFITTLKSAKLDAETCWQVTAWWWKQRKAQIDAYVYTARMYLQVDGTKHTAVFRGKQAPHSIATDVECCVAAWEAGVSLMRIHHEDVSDSMSLKYAVAFAKQQQCIALSPSFDRVKWQQTDGSWHTYTSYLSARLKDSVMITQPCGNIIFEHKQ